MESSCLTQTGHNRSVTSFTYFTANTCNYWPPRSVVPASTAKLAFSCVGHSPPNFSMWKNPAGGQCAGYPDSTGVFGDCYCKNHFFFSDHAATYNTHVAGVIAMTLDSSSAITYPPFKLILK